MRKDKAIKFLRLSKFLAQEFSKDPSTKVGAQILHAEDYSVLTQGYNGMPRGVDESRPERQERPMKYHFYEHGERNAAFNLARKQLKGSTVITTAVPSTSCARAIVSVGASRVFFPRPAVISPELEIALQLFSECGVEVGYTFAGAILGEQTRDARKLSQYVAHAQHLTVSLAKDPQATATLFLSPDDYTLLSQGYSGLPRGADDSRLERYSGELRSVWVETSVRNAIYNVLRADLKGSVGVVTATPCIECARMFVSVGASEVVFEEPTADMQARWGASFESSLGMLAEMGIKATSVTAAELASDAGK